MKIPKKWILVKNGENVVEILDVLHALIPKKHLHIAMQNGEWNEEGEFWYTIEDNWYMVVPYPPLEDDDKEEMV